MTAELGDGCDTLARACTGSTHAGAVADLLAGISINQATGQREYHQQLGGLLEGIGGNATDGQDEFRGKNRFFRLNEQNRTVLTQYEASGGFFAHDIDGFRA